MATTYEPIVTTTGDGSSTTISLNSIPNTYTDLRLIVSGTNPSSARTKLTFNNDTGANYSATWLSGDGTTATSGATSGAQNSLFYAYTINPSSTIPMLIDANIFNYKGSTYKTVLTSGSVDKNGSGNTERNVSLWQSTSAITSIQIIASGAWPTTATFTLYGIKAA